MPDSQKKMVLVMLAVVASISPVLAIMGKLIKVFADGPIAVGNLMKGFGKLQTAIAGINAPVVAIVAVIAVLVAAFTHLWNTNENFRNNMIAIWDQIRGKISSFVDNVKERFSGLNISFEDIVSTLKAIWDGFCEILAPVFEGAFAALADTITTVCDVLIGILDTFIGLFTGNWEQCWTGIQEVFGGIWEGIKAVLTDVLEALKGVIDTFLGWFGTDLDTVWSEITSTVESVWNGIVDFFASVWNRITSAASSAWETIKNVITVAIMLIGEIISAAVQIISLPWRFIWENCKEYIIAAWETIKNVISSALNTISSVISAGWNAISAVVSPVIDTIINIVSSGWNLISSVVSNVAQGILGVVSSVWNSISGVVSSVMGTISSVMSSGWNAAKGVVTSAISGIRSVISSGLHSASSVVSSVLSGIKSRFSNIWNGCKSVVSSAINHIKSAMNFSWSLPKLKLPHPKIEGKFSLDPPSVPHFSIDWYAKAMDAGMIMNRPTVFGYDAVSNKLMAGGEAGSETVVGTQSLMNMIQDAVNNSGNRDDGAIQALLEAIYNWMRNGGLYTLLIDALTNGVEVEFDNREIARLVKKYA